MRTFLSTLERLHEGAPRWSAHANEARRFRDLAALLLAAGGNAIGMGAAWHIHPQRLTWQDPVLMLSLALALASMVILMITPRWSYKPRPAASV